MSMRKGKTMRKLIVQIDGFLRLDAMTAIPQCRICHNGRGVIIQPNIGTTSFLHLKISCGLMFKASAMKVMWGLFCAVKLHKTTPTLFLRHSFLT